LRISYGSKYSLIVGNTHGDNEGGKKQTRETTSQKGNNISRLKISENDFATTDKELYSPKIKTDSLLPEIDFFSRRTTPFKATKNAVPFKVC